MLVDLTLTPDYFLEGSPCNPHGCPTWIALRRLLLPGLKLIIQPEVALISDPINPVLHTVQFPDELVETIYDHDCFGHMPVSEVTFQLDIPRDFLRNEITEARGQEKAPQEIVSEAEFTEALRAAFKDLDWLNKGLDRSIEECNKSTERLIAKISEPRELKYGGLEHHPELEEPLMSAAEERARNKKAA